jgi:RND family efflux transporter MFP subunit
MNRILIPLAFVLWLVYGCGGKQEASFTQPNDRIPVKVMPLLNAAPTDTLIVSGKFMTDNEVPLSFKTGGVVDRVMVDEGSSVQAGQLLATLHLNEVNSMLSQATLALEKAERDLQRVTNLYKDSVASLEQLQNAGTARDLARQQLSVAQFNRRHSEIRAPRAGYVLRKLASEGQVVGPGMPVLLVNSAGSADWILRVGLSDSDWRRVKKGDNAEVGLSAGAAFCRAVVLRKAEAADPYSGSFFADLQLNHAPQNRVASGMYGTARIFTSGRSATTTEDKWSIPYDALLDGDGSNGFVFVTADSSTVKKIPVRVDALNRDMITVTGPFPESSLLILSGSAYLNEESKIRIVP